MNITRLNPDSLHKNPGFTQVAVVERSAKLVYVGGQNGVDVNGKIVGDDIGSQTEQAYKNVISALDAAGATMQDVFKMTVYIVQGQPIPEAFAAYQRVQTQRVEPPTISVIVVAALGRPEFLIEIEAVAAIN